jgi:hypothetical protein
MRLSDIAMFLPCYYHALAMLLPCSCHALVMLLPCSCHALASLFPHTIPYKAAYSVDAMLPASRCHCRAWTRAPSSANPPAAQIVAICLSYDSRMCNVVSMAALLLPLWLDGARCLRHVAMRRPSRHAGAQELAQSVQSNLHRRPTRNSSQRRPSRPPSSGAFSPARRPTQPSTIPATTRTA